jgi:hypothetical protein
LARRLDDLASFNLWISSESGKRNFEQEVFMPMSNGELNLFLLKSDGLVRCRWDGNSERVDVLDRALNGETVRELAPDPFQRNRLYAATLTKFMSVRTAAKVGNGSRPAALDYRDIWTMAVHPIRPHDLYVANSMA